MPKVSFDKVQRMWETKHELNLVRQQKLDIDPVDDKLEYYEALGYSVDAARERLHNIKLLESAESELVSERLRTKPWNPAYV